MEMAAFKAYLKKECIESIRQYRYIIFAVGIIGFAILDPVMLKLLPKLMGDKIPGDLSSLMVFTPKSTLNSYIKDLNQIGIMVAAFALGGILCEERTSEKFVFPYSKGSSPAGIVLAKFIYYTIMISLFIVLGFIIAYYYAGILFKGEKVGIVGVLDSALLISIYFIFVISLSMLLSSIVKKGVTAGFITLITVFIISSISGIKAIDKFLPCTLVTNAYSYTLNSSGFTILFTMLCGAIFVALAIVNMKRSKII